VFEICGPDAAGVIERSLEFKELLVESWAK